MGTSFFLSYKLNLFNMYVDIGKVFVQEVVFILSVLNNNVLDYQC